MKKGLRLAAFILVVSALAACDDLTPAPQDTSRASAADQQVNTSLDTMARLFAQAVTNQALREQIHTQVAKRFDGDTNVLYQTLSTASDVRSKLAGAYSRGVNVQAGDALHAVDGLARAIPRFQIAVPAQFEAWDAASYTPLVGYVPEGVEDTELQTITAYDAQGTIHKLDAQVEPVQPVIILGLNERTDDAGNLVTGSRSQDDAFTLSPQGMFQVRLVKVHLHDDQEPWPKGDAETMLIAKGPGLWWRDEIDYLDDSKDILWPYEVLGTTGGGVRFFWYEKDGTNLDITVTVRGVSLGVKIDDSDDEIGGEFLRNRLFRGTSPDDKRYFGELTQWTD
jgi:Flp pilus assembly protein TadG